MHESVNDAESLDFVISGTINKKMQVHQFQVDIVPPACSFVKNKTPTQVFSCKYLEIFQPAALFRTRLWDVCFPVNFTKFLRTLILKNTCEGLLLMIWSLPDT